MTIPTNGAPALSAASQEAVDVDAIEARANAATPGPWTVRSHPRFPEKAFVEAPRLQAEPPYDIEVLAEDHGGGHYPDSYWEADLTFVAAARQDVPMLVSEVRRLVARLAALAATGDAPLAAQLAAARAERDALGIAVRAAADDADYYRLRLESVQQSLREVFPDANREQTGKDGGWNPHAYVCLDDDGEVMAETDSEGDAVSALIAWWSACSEQAARWEAVRHDIAYLCDFIGSGITGAEDKVARIRVALATPARPTDTGRE